MHSLKRLATVGCKKTPYKSLFAIPKMFNRSAKLAAKWSPEGARNRALRQRCLPRQVKPVE